MRLNRMMTIDGKKGQASMEMFTTVGIFIAFLIPMILLLITLSGQNFEEVSKAQSAVVTAKLAQNINSVYLGGSNTTKQILINLPSNVKSLNISNGEVKISLNTMSGITEESYPIFANLSREYNSDRKGLMWITIKNINEKVVVE